MDLDRDEAVAYYGRAMERLAEHGWRREQAHTIAVEAGSDRYGAEFIAIVVQEGLFSRLGHAIGGASHYDPKLHPHGRGGQFVETPDRPQQKSMRVPTVTDKAKAMMAKIAEGHAKFGGSDDALRHKFATGTAGEQDLRRMREQAMRAISEWQTLNPGQQLARGNDPEPAARSVQSLIKSLEHELGLSVQTAQQEKPVSSEELIRRTRNRPIQKTMLDPYGHFVYQEQGG
jgi:hypothetical protein